VKKIGALSKQNDLKTEEARQFIFIILKQNIIPPLQEPRKESGLKQKSMFTLIFSILSS